MARDTSPQCKQCRREGQKLFLKGERCLTDKCGVERRAYPPGDHGRGRQKQSEYRVQLREKQKARRYYGVLEKQFRIYYDKASRQEGITGENRNQYARMVSTQRPWCRGFVVLPPEAPRVPLEVSMPPKTVPRYPHMEWAFATGHSKKYASAGWASYDGHFFRWAERAGYAVDLASQHDLHFSPEVVAGYDCVVFVGHDDVEGRHAQFAAIVMERVESGEARLAIGREHGLEALVDEGEDRGAGAEVGGDR